MTITKRLYYLDNLRVALTILVIAHHVGQAYGPTGGWWPVQEVARAAVLGPFFSVNRSFFMSLFFMISGYLMVAAYDRNGPRAFVRSRLVRLGVPALAFALFMLPFRVFVLGEHVASWTELINVAHLWYIEHLLLFSLHCQVGRDLGLTDEPLLFFNRHFGIELIFLDTPLLFHRCVAPVINGLVSLAQQVFPRLRFQGAGDFGNGLDRLDAYSQHGDPQLCKS